MAGVIKTDHIPWRTKKYSEEEKAYGVYREISDPDLADAQINVRLTKIAPGETSTKYHSHSASEEWFYVLAGRCKMALDGRWHTIEQGDAVHCPTGCWHTFVNDSREGCQIIMVSTVRGDDEVQKASPPKFG